MLNVTHSLIGSLELAVMECFWERGPRTSRQILSTLRNERTIAHTTVTSTLARLYEQGFLIREPIRGYGPRQSWRYTACYASRGALLANTFEQLSAQVGANHLDRAEALGMLLGVVR
jgi:predicted transcriptional regulator